MLPRTFKNRPIWSHNSSHKVKINIESGAAKNDSKVFPFSEFFFLSLCLAVFYRFFLSFHVGTYFLFVFSLSLSIYLSNYLRVFYLFFLSFFLSFFLCRYLLFMCVRFSLYIYWSLFSYLSFGPCTCFIFASINHFSLIFSQ